MTTAVCPVCHRAVPVRGGRLARHQGDVMRWSGRRWFRDTCKGSGRLAPTAHIPGVAGVNKED